MPDHMTQNIKTTRDPNSQTLPVTMPDHMTENIKITRQSESAAVTWKRLKLQYALHYLCRQSHVCCWHKADVVHGTQDWQ